MHRKEKDRFWDRSGMPSVVLAFYVLFVCGTIYGQEIGLDIHADFAGGNVLVEKMIGDTLWLAPDTRNISGDWFYWYFAAESPHDREATFIFSKDKIPSFGPAVSLDSGKTWQWMFDDVHKGMSKFTYKLKANEEARFSIGFPYVLEKYQQFISRYEKHPLLKIDTLCVLESGREVPLLYINNPNFQTKGKIVLTARHHACEMMASYSLEGMLVSLLEDQKNKWLTDNYEFMIVPFVDLDGVEEGDQGKNRRPRDHNRDYSGKNLYQTTKSIKETLSKWAGDDELVAIDLHCPGLVGSGHELLYVVGSKEPRFAQEEALFAPILANTTKNGLRFFEADLLEYGKSWNVDGGEQQGDSFRSWVQKSFPQAKLVTILEVPYANNKGQRVTLDNLRQFGADFLQAIHSYLRSN